MLATPQVTTQMLADTYPDTFSYLIDDPNLANRLNIEGDKQQYIYLVTYRYYTTGTHFILCHERNLVIAYDFLSKSKTATYANSHVCVSTCMCAGVTLHVCARTVCVCVRACVRACTRTRARLRVCTVEMMFRQPPIRQP